MKKIIALRNFLRVVGISSALVVALSVGASAAKAAVTVGGGNGTTGPNSENENEWSINHHIDIDVTNSSVAENGQEFLVGTGCTWVDQNTKVEDLSTGDVIGSIEVDNTLNNGDIHLMSMDPASINVQVANNTTGPNSENENEIKISNNNDVDISNSATIDNSLDLSVNTGKNKISHNTVVGDISTGDIRFTASIDNSANANAGDVDLSGMGGMNVVAGLSNQLTGPQSSNENSLNISSNSDIDVNNSSAINNDVSVSANSGGNTIDHNTVVGDISTGSVQINVSSTNSAN